jgi:hypothetical protein
MADGARWLSAHEFKQCVREFKQCIRAAQAIAAIPASAHWCSIRN